MKKSLFSWIIAIAIAMPNLSFAQQATKGKMDTIAQFVIVKKESNVNEILIQLQQDKRPVAAEGAWYTETSKGELIPLKDGASENVKKRAKLVLMNWGDLPKENDTAKVENRIRGFFDLDHPYVHPINGGKDGYQMEMIVIRSASGKEGAKPMYGFLDLKKTMANQLKDGTTYQVLVSIADTAKGKIKVFKNQTSYYYSVGERNFSFDNSGKKLLINCDKVVPVRIHWVKLSKKGLLIEA